MAVCAWRGKDVTARKINAAMSVTGVRVFFIEIISLAKREEQVNREDESNSPAEKLDRLADALVEIYFWLPTEDFLGACDIGLSHFRVIHRQGFLLDRAVRARDAKDFFGELADRHLARVADVHRLVEVRHHEAENSLEKIRYETKTSRLRAIAKN